MRRVMFLAPLLAALFLAGSGMNAEAGTVSVNFDSLGSGVGNSSIQSYLNTQLACGSCVTVSGSALTEKGYTGDGHVVGSSSTTPYTLGTTDGATVHSSLGCTVVSGVGSCSGTGLDTFIRNNPGTSSFTFAFTGINITSVSFDYEIFPDASCQALTTAACGAYNSATGTYASQPDFTFSTNLATVFHLYGLAPGTGTSQPTGATIAAGMSSTGSEATKMSQLSSTEATPQLIGQTGLLSLGAGTNSLTFADWPATIGIDNLTINYSVPTVPEPASMLLLGTGLAGLYVRRRRRQRAAK